MNIARRLWALALPLMLANSSIALLGLVDTAVIGHLDDEQYLAGVAIATILFDFLYWGVTFLRMGTTGVVAQNYGARNSTGFRTAFLDALIVSLLIGTILVLFRNPIMHFFFSFVNGTESALFQASIYYKIKIWGAPGVLGAMVIVGWLVGMQNARAALVLAAIPSAINALLDYLFVVELEMGVAGAATGSLIAAYFSLGLGLFLVSRELKKHADYQPYRFKRSRVLAFFKLNYNIFVRTLCLIFAFAIFTRQGAVQGNTIVASNALLLNFQMLLALALDGYANALEVLVGDAIGGERQTQFREAIVVGTKWSVITALIFTTIYFVYGEMIIGVLTSIESIRATAEEYLPWVIASPLISVWCFILDGVFIGATKAKAMRNSMMFAAIIVYLPAVIALQDYANHGLWAAFMLFFFARGLSMAWLFRQMHRRGEFFREA